jgi:hypothetical protein
MAARKNKVTLSDTWRQRIQAGVIMDRLMKHIDGSIEMSATQVNAAKIVLGKIEPDLARTESKVEGDIGLTVTVNYPKD